MSYYFLGLKYHLRLFFFWGVGGFDSKVVSLVIFPRDFYVGLQYDFYLPIVCPLESPSGLLLFFFYAMLCFTLYCFLILLAFRSLCWLCHQIALSLLHLIFPKFEHMNLASVINNLKSILASDRTYLFVFFLFSGVAPLHLLGFSPWFTRACGSRYKMGSCFNGSASACGSWPVWSWEIESTLWG